MDADRTVWTLRGAEFSISPKDGELSCFSSFAIFFCVPTGLLCESCGVLTTVTIHILKKVSDAIPARHPPLPPSLQCARSRAGAALRSAPGFPLPSRGLPVVIPLCWTSVSCISQLLRWFQPFPKALTWRASWEGWRSTLLRGPFLPFLCLLASSHA